ncbi:MAG: protein kinase domain-containing protein [Thermoanaerobaculia bacterium]
MTLAAGSRLGHYEILEPVGEGAMGEVYRAEDKRLGRRVALKVLRATFSKDEWVLARFEQEARSASALNHPNIVTIYDIGRDGESFFFAMELIEGKSLREVLGGGSLPIRRLLKIAAPMAQGIACAHDAGIFHRDLKPENIMVGRDDRVKILDFGIAKLAPERPLVPSSPTVRVVFPTEPGMIVGTVGYMSPEQAKMESTDHRADQFSFGAILYEMAVGRRAFQKDTAVDTLASIIHDEPEPIAKGNPAPVALRWIIARCLSKDPAGRYASTDDLSRDLVMLRDHLPEALSPSPGVPAVTLASVASVSPPSQKGFFAKALAALLLALAGAGIAWIAGVSGLASRRTGFGSRPDTSAEFSQLTFQPGIETFPSLSPDGKTFVFVSSTSGNRDIFLQRIGGRNAINLTADCKLDDDQPAFSPDGEQIAFRSERSGGGLFVMGATGESVRRLTNFGFNPSWSPDGSRIVFATEGIFDASTREATSELRVITVATGEIRRIGNGDAVEPSWSPHGDRIAYWGLPNDSARRTIWTVKVGQAGRASEAGASGGSDGGTPVPVTSDEALNWDPVWAPDGRTLYFASDRSGATSLWRIAISEKTGEVSGPPRPLTPPALWSGQMSVSRDGRRILYAALERRMALETAAFDPSKAALAGPFETVYDGPQGIESLGLSPDGRWAVFTSAQPAENLFLFGLDGSGLAQLTSDRSRRRGARWSPDGRWITFHSNAGGVYQIWKIHPDGSSLARATALPGGAFEARWSPDGSRLFVLTPGGTCLLDAGKLSDPAGCIPVPKLNAEGDTFFANEWSPDGSRLAGETWQPSGIEIPGIVAYSFSSHEFRRVSDRGVSPVWLSDSRRLLYLDGERLWLLDTGDGKARAVGGPGGAALPRDFRIAESGNFALSRNDKKLYFVRDASQGDIWQMTIR